MNKPIFFLLLVLLSSCSVTEYYQVYEVNTENGSITNDCIVFEDRNCVVKYNLWSDGGKLEFSVYNKTENDIYLDLSKSFFVLNSVSNQYFQNRSFSASSNSGTSVTTYGYPFSQYWYLNPYKVTGTIASGITTTYIEKSVLTIPPKTLQYISEFRVVNGRYINCDLPKYPSSKNIITLDFDKSNSPFVFYNLISYSINDKEIKMENKFYVSEVTNYPSDKMFITIDTSVCGRKLDHYEKVFKDRRPDKFYFRYEREK